MTTSENRRIALELIVFVEEFRREAAKYPPRGFPKFPTGACNWASEILGQLLNAKGFGVWNLVKNVARPDASREFKSHDWLERDGVVIDATADQFRTCDEFIGEDLPFVHVGNTPLNRVFKFSEKRNVIKEGVHMSAQGAHLQIRTALGL